MLDHVEIKSFSITRLKRNACEFLHFSHCVEIKSFSITRLKLYANGTFRRVYDGWNQKFLDYEIETWHGSGWLIQNISIVEIKSFSITRLKLCDWCGGVVIAHQQLKSKVSRLRDWNRCTNIGVSVPRFCVEIKSFSITRLKLFWQVIKGSNNAFCWNQKFLDYEIETLRACRIR